MKSIITQINDYFAECGKDVAKKNWQLLRSLSWIYLCSLLIYYFIIAVPQGIPSQKTTVLIAILVQAVFTLCVLLIKTERVSRFTVYAFLTFFGASIIALSIILGTVVFRDNSALLFPLMLIMMVQFYTLPPVMILPLLGVSVTAFLSLSCYFKPVDVLYLDVLSTVVAIFITLISYYTSCKAKADEAAIKNELQYLGTHDPLTGLLNRAAFSYIFNNMAGSMNGAQYALVIADIDNFKMINDVKGHVIGDKVLIGFAAAMKESFNCGGTSLTVGRFGGDEFVAFITVENGEDGIVTSVRQLMKLCGELGETQGMEIGCSVGIAVSQDANENLDALLLRADDALYSVKREGGHDFMIHSA